MRNLRNIKHTAIRFDDGDQSQLSATAWDGADLICSFGPSSSDSTITLQRIPENACSHHEAITIASWQAPSPNPDLPHDRVLKLHCFGDSGLISLVLEGGDIVTVRADAQPGNELIEIVGSVDAGITAAAWSPDEELLLIATKADTVLFMTRDFESTASASLSADDIKVSEHVSVGWGKKETQFQGRGAKALKDPTVPDHIDEGRLSDFDDMKTCISWRGDGAFVAINSLLDVEPTRRRVLRVYSRDGTLDSVSEPVDGLEGGLSWKPSGQLIAGVQRRDDRTDIVFFERNGLRHGEFSLRISGEELDTSGTSIALAWNSDSSILAVSTKDRVQLWTMGNYHYYLKQEILLEDEGRVAANIHWHPERHLQLACFAGKSLRLLGYNLTVSHGPVVPPHDQGVVAVVDGRLLKITPLRTANVPPPMAFDEVDLPANAIDVAIGRQGRRIAVLHAQSVTILECDYGLRSGRKAQFVNQILCEENGDYGIARQIAFDENEDVIIVKSGINAPGDKLVRPAHSQILHMEDSLATLALSHCTNHDRLYRQNSIGAVYEINQDDADCQIAKLPTTCPSIGIWKDCDVEIVFGLTVSGLLHVIGPNQTLKIASCTSFVVTATHLIYTTSQHLLKFVHLHTGELEVPADEPEKDERCRNIERGAKLVTVMPSAYSLVLQMPRGNLETIYPRALVLAGIRHAIGERDYKKAFSICRTQRVDMNILHDYDPKQFMPDVSLFIKQLKKVEYIDLFLSSLSADDVSQTIYKETMKPQTNGLGKGEISEQNSRDSTSVSKVNRICDAFLEALRGHETSYLQSIVTAHVCKSPPDLEAGLSLVAVLRKQEKQEQLEQAVEHICFLADVNQLYDTALGIYDLDVALLVAQQSQKDPREYLPYLQSLHDMPQLKRQHAIDNDLQRYPKALSHLYALGEFEGVKTYAAKHELYNTAIGLYRYDDAKLTELMRIYADFLGSRNRYKEAGIAYEYVGDQVSAFESYRACSMWRECLACAAMSELSEDSMADLARDLAESLIEAKDFPGAATIYLDHLQDVETAARMLCRGYQFSDAMRHVALRKMPSLLQSLIDPGLIEASATMTEMLAEMKTQLHAQIPRLRELRQKKAEDPMGFLDGGGDYDGDVPDNISLAPTDTTTAGTFMTRYTNRSMGTLATNATRKTSKNRRREERKRAKGKKGTVYEEEYLVNSIARLMERLNTISEDISRLVEGLMRRAMRERAVAVDAAFQEVADACKACTDEVFSPPTLSVDGNDMAKENGVQRPWGGQGVLWEALTASQQKREAPVLKAFERLTLLDK